MCGLKTLGGIGCAILASWGAARAGAQVTFFDGDFAESGWEHSILWSRGAVTLGPMRREASGGNPGAYQRGEHTSDGPWATIYDGHLYLDGGSYDPAVHGAIDTIDVEYDYIDFLPGGTQNGILLRQDGRSFIRAVDSSGHSAWTRVALTGLTGGDPNWSETTAGGVVSGAPDLSATAAPIVVGYYTFNWSLSQGFFIQREWGIDNFTVTMNPQSLPCPADLNGDGVIDLADLGILLADFGCVAPGPCPGDIDGDGDTDLADLGILLSEFGNACP